MIEYDVCTSKVLHTLSYPKFSRYQALSNLSLGVLATVGDGIVEVALSTWNVVGNNWTSDVPKGKSLRNLRIVRLPVLCYANALKLINPNAKFTRPKVLSKVLGSTPSLQAERHVYTRILAVTVRPAALVVVSIARITLGAFALPVSILSAGHYAEMNFVAAMGLNAPSTLFAGLIECLVIFIRPNFAKIF